MTSKAERCFQGRKLFLENKGVGLKLRVWDLDENFSRIISTVASTAIEVDKVIVFSKCSIVMQEGGKHKKRKKGREAKKLLVRQQLDCWDGLCAMEPSSICQHGEL